MKRIILIFAVGITLNTAGCAWKVPEFRKVPELTQEKKDFLDQCYTNDQAQRTLDKAGKNVSYKGYYCCHNGIRQLG